LEDLEQIVGSIEIAKFSASIKSPGMMKRHYAPKIPMRLNADYKREGEAFLGFGSCCDVTLNLSPSGNLMEAAANLFRMMRQLDESRLYTGIAVAPIPSYGLGLAINDRLMRAASLEETTGN
jgi:L-threonylcarbamoyladenylate synthase